MKRRLSDDRLTVSLAEGQREALVALAEANGVTLAFVARYALTEFLERQKGQQLRLELLTPANDR